MTTSNAGTIDSTTLSNVQVAEDLSLSSSGVSRLRSGERFPSLRVMTTIQAVYGWTVQHQADARVDGNWHEIFESVLAHQAASRGVPNE